MKHKLDERHKIISAFIQLFQEYIVDMEAFDADHKEGRISWKAKLPPVLTAQSSTVAKAVVKEPTS